MITHLQDQRETVPSPQYVKAYSTSTQQEYKGFPPKSSEIHRYQQCNETPVRSHTTIIINQSTRFSCKTDVMSEDSYKTVSLHSQIPRFGSRRVELISRAPRELDQQYDEYTTQDSE